MTKEEYKERLRKAVNEYILEDEAYDDHAQLCINPDTLEVFISDSREVDVDDPNIDCYDVMDLVEMDAEGKWKVDEEAVAEVAAEYC